MTTKIIDGEIFNVYNLADLTNEEKLNLIKELEFDVEVNVDGSYQLADLQGANIGGIEDKSYKTINEMIERLDIYWSDYFILFENEE